MSSQDLVGHLSQLSCLLRNWRGFSPVVLLLVLAVRGFRGFLHSAHQTCAMSAHLLAVSRSGLLTTALVSPDSCREELGYKLATAGRSCSLANRRLLRRLRNHSRCRRMRSRLRSTIQRLLRRHSQVVLEAMPTAGCMQTSCAHDGSHTGFAVPCQVH